MTLSGEGRAAAGLRVGWGLALLPQSPPKAPLPCADTPAAPNIPDFPHPEPRDRVTHVRVTPARHSRESCRDRLSLFPVPPVQGSAVVLWAFTKPKVPFHTFSLCFTQWNFVGEKPGERKPSCYSSGAHCSAWWRLRDSGKKTFYHSRKSCRVTSYFSPSGTAGSVPVKVTAGTGPLCGSARN